MSDISIIFSLSWINLSGTPSKMHLTGVQVFQGSGLGARLLELVYLLSTWRCSGRLKTYFFCTRHIMVGEAAGGSSPSNTLPWHSHPQYLCSGRWKQNGCNSSPILSKSAFQFLGFTVQILLIPIAHSVTCWRTDIVSSRSAASSLTVKTISKFFFGQFYAWLSLCAIYLGDNNNVIL